ncbi:MAG: OB-fold nucleic acid binding domain-containing protein, partial [Candidatus Acidiferrales bacterium]
EKESESFCVRLGLRYVRGLRAEVGAEIVRERGLRAFASIADLKLRVPGLRKAELATLAEIGALNFIGGARGAHRRDALWQIERVARNAGPLLERCEAAEEEAIAIAGAVAGAEKTTWDSPLLPMTAEERLVADFHGTGMTVGPHPMKYHRARMKRQGAVTASELNRMPHGTYVRFAGGVIARQRPGTAHGFVFLSLEDETGIANAIITPQLFAEQHVAIVSQQFLWVEGRLQNQDNVVSVKVENVRGLLITEAETASHDFH